MCVVQPATMHACDRLRGNLKGGFTLHIPIPLGHLHTHLPAYRPASYKTIEEDSKQVSYKALESLRKCRAYDFQAACVQASGDKQNALPGLFLCCI